MKTKDDNTKGVIYILTNQSFPNYVKIGYADDVEKRLKELNRSECTPFAFRIYATYAVNQRLTDIRLHSVIDKLNPNLRSIDNVNGKKRVREFYAITKEDAYSIFEAIAEINGTMDRLNLYDASEIEKDKEERKEEARTKVTHTSFPKMDWLIKEGLVNIGDEVYVYKYPEEVAIIKDNEHVEYKGELMSFNKFGQKVTGWKSIQCYAWMKVKGKDETLADMRDRRMKEVGMIE